MDNKTIKTVIDIYGTELQIDESTRKLYDYSNKNQTIEYNAEVVEDGKHTGSFTNYVETGTIDDIEKRLKKWDNAVMFEYASAVGFNAKANDPDKKLWKAFVDYVRKNELEIFTAEGDFKNSCVVDIDIIKKLAYE